MHMSHMKYSMNRAVRLTTQSACAIVGPCNASEMVAPGMTQAFRISGALRAGSHGVPAQSQQHHHLRGSTSNAMCLRTRGKFQRSKRRFGSRDPPQARATEMSRDGSDTSVRIAAADEVAEVCFHAFLTC